MSEPRTFIVKNESRYPVGTSIENCPVCCVPTVARARALEPVTVLHRHGDPVTRIVPVPGA